MESGHVAGGRWRWWGVPMKCENTGSCLKHPLEGGAAEQMGVKELRDELFEHRIITVNITWPSSF